MNGMKFKNPEIHDILNKRPYKSKMFLAIFLI